MARWRRETRHAVLPFVRGRRQGRAVATPSAPPGSALHSKDLVEATGVSSRDRGGWELLLGIKATAEGYLVRTSVEVDYRIGDKRYTFLLPGHLAVCTSTKLERRGDCPLPPSE